MTTTPHSTVDLFLPDEAATERLGGVLAERLQPPAVVYLRGDLGAGKTTLSRGLLRGLGHSGSVKSPTYTIVEPYELDGVAVYHFDLYRLGDPQELDYLGLRDYLNQKAVVLFEWPERGGAFLPAADLIIELSLEAPETDTDMSGRRARLISGSDLGSSAIAQLSL